MRRALVLGCGGLALAAIALGHWTVLAPLLIWNASPSIPLGLYRLQPTSRLGTGDIVAYRPGPELSAAFAARGYLPEGLPLLKPIAATAPSVVCRSGNQVVIDGRAVAEALQKDAANRPLPRWKGCVRLGPNQIFLLAGDVPDALDSRYFGPVDRRDLLGRVTPFKGGGGAG